MWIICLHVGSYCRQYSPQCQQIVIDFKEIDWNNMAQLPPSPVKEIENTEEQCNGSV
jgi:hypothetical protein